MISGIHIASSRMVINKDNINSEISLPQLKNNQIVKAKVLELMANGKTLILIDNQKIAAQTSMPLQPGEEINLKVLLQKDTTILKLINSTTQMTTKQISSLVSFFGKNSLDGIVDSKIPGVKELLYDISLKFEKADKNFLPRLIEKSGISLENKLADVVSDSNIKSDITSDIRTDIKTVINNILKQDIKGNILLELFGRNLSQTSEKMQSFKAAVSFLETVENFQLLNNQNSDSGRFLLPFPVFNEAEFSFGQLLIDTGGKSNNKKEDKVIKISFLLNMSNIGAVRADFSILKKEITGRFLFQDEETCAYFESMIPELKERLSKIEYKALKIECSIAKEEEIQPESFIEALVKASDERVLNIVI